MITDPNGNRIPKLFSVDNPKSIKSQKYGFLNAILYMHPHISYKNKNVCPNATKGCIALCLGTESGQASMRKENEDNNVTLSRKYKTRLFFEHRTWFLNEVVKQIKKVEIKAKKNNLKTCIRLNGSSDLSYEKIKFLHEGKLTTILEIFPHIQFVDYTKNINRIFNKPKNLDLTFSRSESNWHECLTALKNKINVAIVIKNLKPHKFFGFDCVNGDLHDLRFLDKKGCVVTLSPKGNKAKKSLDNFVINPSFQMSGIL